MFEVVSAKRDFLISSFRRVLYVVCFLLGNTRRLEFICRRFGTLCLFHLHRQVDVYLPMKMGQNVPKHRHINSRCWVINQKKAYNKKRFIFKLTHSTKTTKMLCSADVFVLSTKFRISTESGSGQLSTVRIYLWVLYITLSWYNLLLLARN